jgi:hypothetical protein
MYKLFFVGALVASMLGTGLFPGTSDAQRPTREPVSSLSYLNGSWITTPSTQTADGEWQASPSRAFADFEFTLDRNIIEGDLSPLPPTNIHSRLFITYDVVRNYYRVISMDDYWGWVLVMTGEISENGTLVVDNIGTDTSWRNQSGGWTDTRMTFERVDTNHARITHQLSHDGGETWFGTERLDLNRRYPQ